MKILICSDIHGNYQAIQALLKSKSAKFADKILILGDLVCMGPQPNEVIDLIKNNPKIQVIMGNHDKWVAIEPPPSSVNSKNIKIKHHIYMKDIITEENLEYLKKLPYFIRMKFGNVKFHFTHYGWKDKFIEVVDHPDSVENNDNIDSIFGKVKADVIFFGHNHDPLEFEKDNTKYICVGTLGMSKYGNYCMLTVDKNGNYLIERKTLAIQKYKTLKLMKQLKYPRYNLYMGYLLGTLGSFYQTDNENEENKAKNDTKTIPVSKIIFRSSDNNLKDEKIQKSKQKDYKTNKFKEDRITKIKKFPKIENSIKINKQKNKKNH